jgi:hypothetical protein
MSTTVNCVNTIGVAVNAFRITVIILEGNLDSGGIYLLIDIYWFRMFDLPVPVQVMDITRDTTFKIKGFLNICSVILDGYLQSFVKIGNFSDALAQGIDVIGGIAKNLLIG